MHGTDTATEPADHTPLLSNRFLAILTVAVMVLALLSFGISLFGHRFGERWSLAGHSDSTETFDTSIGLDRLRITANTIRFADQRKHGATERLDLYLLWPEMTGYSKENRRRFDDLTQTQSLIFLQLSQSTMSRHDKPVYAVRCLLPGPDGPASGSDCQRDIHVGRDLTVLYRFSSDLLSDWQRIDSAIEGYIRSRIVSAPRSATLQKRANAATNDSL